MESSLEISTHTRRESRDSHKLSQAWIYRILNVDEYENRNKTRIRATECSFSFFREEKTNEFKRELFEL